MTLVDPRVEAVGVVLTDYPAQESILNSGGFFQTLFQQYDLRFVYQAPALKGVTKRHVWHPDSPALKEAGVGKEMQLRMGEEVLDEDDEDTAAEGEADPDQ